MREIRIGDRVIGTAHPTYVIAEVGSNFDGELKRLKGLARLAKDTGADCFKIQNFLAPKIVSEHGFAGLQVGFQARWDKSVVEVYRAAEFPRVWLPEISDYCREIGIGFFSAPYDKEAVDLLERIDVPAYKVGSGEIDHLDFLEYVAKTGKPILLGCGSCNLAEIDQAVRTIRGAGNDQILLMQCITNYPAPVAQTNLRVLQTLAQAFDVPVGCSDHTIGSEGGGDDPLNGLTVPLGAVALGARCIEKHFTDDRRRDGPDHSFAMQADVFARMVEGIRALEKALGSGVKDYVPAETQTRIVQRRSLYASRNISVGEELSPDNIEALRPALGLSPSRLKDLCGRRAGRDIKRGELIQVESVVGARAEDVVHI